MNTDKKSNSSLDRCSSVPGLWLIYFVFFILPANFAAAQTTRPAGPTTAGTAMGADRIPHPAPTPGKTIELTLEQLGNFEFDPGKDSTIPADVKALSGSTVRITGFMIPMDQPEQITKFALVPTLERPNWGPPPPVQRVIVVKCSKGKSASYTDKRIAVEGKLTVAVVKDDGFTVGIFAVDCTSVKPAGNRKIGN